MVILMNRYTKCFFAYPGRITIRKFLNADLVIITRDIVNIVSVVLSHWPNAYHA